jgi:pyruvate/2-oxoglutarate dehydrogenase complex dihydrolipoamide dehydrogenase (E3) component
MTSDSTKQASRSIARLHRRRRALRTTNPEVWALGDCNGKGAFTHTSYNDYEIVADNLFNNAGRKVSERITAYALFTDPPLGRVGMTEAEIKRAGIQALVGTRPMTRVGRRRERRDARVHEDPRRRPEQAHPGRRHPRHTGDEVVHSLLDAMYARLPVPDVARAMRIHPTVSELIPTVLGELRRSGSDRPDGGASLTVRGQLERLPLGAQWASYGRPDRSVRARP